MVPSSNFAGKTQVTVFSNWHFPTLVAKSLKVELSRKKHHTGNRAKKSQTQENKMYKT